MYDTKEWEDIRLVRGWANLYIGGDDFVEFLKKQSIEMAVLMDELGIR
jgi:tripartite-type tricarboxylate transporter receptor subunit TctC